VESLRLIPSGGGRFEVSISEETIFSKAQTGRFPEVEEVIRGIEARLRGASPGGRS